MSGVGVELPTAEKRRRLVFGQVFAEQWNDDGGC